MLLATIEQTIHTPSIMFEGYWITSTRRRTIPVSVSPSGLVTADDPSHAYLYAFSKVVSIF